MFRSIIIFLVISFFAIGSVNAEEAPPVSVIPDIPKPLNVMPSKIKPVQSGEDELSKAAPESNKSSQTADGKQLETLSPSPEKGFGADFVKNLTRKDINNLFSNENKVSQSIFARNLALKIALTPFPVMSDVKEFPENIYGQRLNYLTNLGAFTEAENLYKLNESTPPSALAARAGIETLFATEKIAVACLDQKTFDSSLKADTPEFWEKVSIFCQALLSPAAGNDDELRLTNASRAYNEIFKPNVSTIEEINKLDVISTIVMLKMGKLDIFLSVLDNLNKIDDKHIALLVKFSPKIQSSLPLIAEGLERGIVSSDEALNFLKLLDRGNETRENSTPQNYTDFLKEYFKNPDAPFLTDKLLDLAVNNLTKETLLYPLYKGTDLTYPESNKILSLRLIALTNQDLPLNFVKSAYPIEKVDENGIDSGESLLIKILIEKLKPVEKNPPNSAYAALLALSYANYPQKDVKNSYDNILSLTGFDNYVMHNTDILNDLKKFANKKQADKVVTRCLALIDDLPLEKLHPTELYQILEALNSAGLTEETTHLTREVLGNIMKN